jgi:protein pelota
MQEGAPHAWPGLVFPQRGSAAPACGIAAGQSIRLRGRNLSESEHVKLGAYHTLELEPQRAFTLEKPSWDALDIERIKQACDPAASADLAAVLITARRHHFLA